MRIVVFSPQVVAAIIAWSIVMVGALPGLAVTGDIVDSATERVGVTDGEILIGSCVPLSGSLQERGKQITLGANLYFDYVNEHGGVNGRKIKLASCDDAYDPDKAISCFNTCLKGKVFAGALFAGSAPISKYVKLGEINRMPMLGFCTGNPVAYEFRPTEFTFRPSYADEVDKQIDALWRLHAIRRIAVIYQNDAAGAAVCENVAKCLKKLGSAPVAEASFPRKTTELDEPISKALAANPQVVLFVGTSEGLLAFVKKRAQEQWKCAVVTYAVADDYLQGMKEADGIVITQVVPEVNEHMSGSALYVKLLHKSHPGEQPNTSAFEAFLNAEIIAEGLQRAGRDLTRTSFIKAMETLQNLDLGVGPQFKVTYSPKNHNGLSPKSVVFTIIKNGKLQPMTDADWKLFEKAAKQRP